MMRRIIAALLLLLAGTVATAQVPFPQTLPANTVYGRLGISAGPGQAIPFSVFISNLLPSLCTTAGAVPVYNAAAGWQCSTAANSNAIINDSLTVPTINGGSAGTSVLKLQDTTSGSPTTAGFKVQSAGGLTSTPTMNAGSSGNNPWEFKTATMNIPATGKWFWTTGTPNAVVDSLYNCTTPLTIPNQPLTADTTFNFCGTYTNSTGSPQFSNMLSATCYVDGSQLDINCAAFTTVGRVAGTGGAGLIGVGKAMVQTAVAHGIELEANCHSPATNCDQARASMFLAGGGNGGLAALAFQSWRSGAAANSVRHGIYLGDGAAINPFQNTGSAVMDSAGTHVRFDYGIDFRNATVNTCAFAAPGGFCVTGAGDVNTGSAAAGHTGNLNMVGATSGTVTVQPQSIAGTYNFNLPTAAGTAGQPLLSGGGGAAAQTYGTLQAAAGGTGDTGTAWTTYTPSVTSGTGTFTTLGAVSGASKCIGKTCFIRINIPITTNGTAATDVRATLPGGMTGAAQFVLNGREKNISGKQLQGLIVGAGTNVTIFNYDGTYPGASGAELVLSGVIEQQ